jgi:uroporphyrinogen-III synthase
VGIALHEDAGHQVEALVHRILRGEVEYAVFMTGPGVYLLMSKADELGVQRELADRLNRLAVVARSHKPQKVLEHYSVRVRLVPTDNTAEGIAAAMMGFDLQGKRVATLWHGAQTPVLRQALEKRGAEVHEVQAYAYAPELEQGGAQVLGALGFNYLRPDYQKILQLVRDVLEGTIHILTFTSPPSARNLYHVAEAHGLLEDLCRQVNANVLVVAVGPPTRRALEEHGLGVEVMPGVYKLGPMVRAIAEYCAHPLALPKQRILAEIPAGAKGAGRG